MGFAPIYGKYAAAASADVLPMWQISKHSEEILEPHDVNENIPVSASVSLMQRRERRMSAVSMQIAHQAVQTHPCPLTYPCLAAIKQFLGGWKLNYSQQDSSSALNKTAVLLFNQKDDKQSILQLSLKYVN